MHGTLSEALGPGSPGTYLLVIPVPDRLTFTAGALGKIVLPPGRYLYAGSALGPGGLAARIARHCRQEKRLRWHIDYLTALAPVYQIITRRSTERQECDWIAALLRVPGIRVPAPRFGASDCRAGCPAHLLRVPDGYVATELQELQWPATT